MRERLADERAVLDDPDVSEMLLGHEQPAVGGERHAHREIEAGDEGLRLGEGDEGAAVGTTHRSSVARRRTVGSRSC